MLKTETAGDRLQLERANDALSEAKRHLKAFARTKLVRDAPELVEAVRATRKRVKKTRRRLQALVTEVDLTTESTDDRGA